MLLLPGFEYENPSSVAEAVSLLQDGSRKPKVLAGGTDLLVQMKEGLVSYGLLVDIKGIADLSRIALDAAGTLTLGSAVTMSELVQWVSSRPGWWSGLAVCADSVGSPQIRNRATVIGNLCRASPSADTAPGLIALDAAVTVAGPAGRRSVPLLEFITGPGRTVLSPQELAVSVSLPEPVGCTELVYIKHGTRRAMDLAAVSVAVRLSAQAETREVQTARIVLGAVAPTPIRLTEGEAVAERDGINPKTIQEIARLAQAKCRPISDVRATAGYRSAMVQVLTRRALAQAWQRLGQGREK